MHHVYLGLGSNLGDRRQLIADAVRLIGERVGAVLRQSSLIETEPWGFHSANRFLNGVILCETRRTPRGVLRATQQIERELGAAIRAAPIKTEPSISTSCSTTISTSMNPILRFPIR